jgi:hypothetical protein
MSKQKRTVNTVITKQYVPSGLHGYNFFKILQLLPDGEKLRLKDLLIKMIRPEQLNLANPHKSTQRICFLILKLGTGKEETKRYFFLKREGKKEENEKNNQIINKK